MCGWQVKLCDPSVTHESYLSALEIKACNKALYKFICLLTFYLFTLLTFIIIKREIIRTVLCCVVY